MASVLGILLSMQETWVECLAPGFHLSCHQLSQAFREWISKLEISESFNQKIKK